MSLTNALRTASSALALNSAQSAIVAKNIANAGDTNYSRKIGEVTSLADGGARIVRVDRAADPAVRTALLGATSSSASSSALVDGLTQLQQTIGDTMDATSPAANLSAFAAALQTYASTPSDASAGRAAVTAANALARSLNDGAAAVQNVREDADAKMSASVDRINSLLADFDKSNAAIVAGLKTGADTTDAADSRDATVKQLANEIGLTSVTRADGSMALYTDGGVTLDESGARKVTMQPSTTLAAGNAGGVVTVDGVAVTGAHASMPLRSGALAGLAQLRDTVAPKYQDQLDAMAGGLIDAFAETNATTGASTTGLFTWSGAPATPNGVIVAGASQSITVAAAVDPGQGGDVTKLRDGTISGVAASANASGAASFSDRLRQLGDSLDASRPFDAAAGLGATASLSSFASASVGWLDGQRQTATAAATSATALSTQAAQSLSNSTGVSLDDQMSQMLSLENAYQASAKLLSTANSMFTSLFAAIT